MHTASGSALHKVCASTDNSASKVGRHGQRCIGRGFSDLDLAGKCVILNLVYDDAIGQRHSGQNNKNVDRCQALIATAMGKKTDPRKDNNSGSIAPVSTPNMCACDEEGNAECENKKAMPLRQSFLNEDETKGSQPNRGLVVGRPLLKFRSQASAPLTQDSLRQQDQRHESLISCHSEVLVRGSADRRNRYDDSSLEGRRVKLPKHPNEDSSTYDVDVERRVHPNGKNANTRLGIR